MNAAYGSLIGCPVGAACTLRVLVSVKQGLLVHYAQLGCGKL
jgi:hypothetical protein